MPRSARRPSRLALAAAALAVCACQPYVQGNGVFIEENRTTAQAFQGVRVESGVEVAVTASVPADQRSLFVSGDANLVPYIETAVEPDATLGISVLHVYVNLSGGYQATIPPRVVIKEQAFQYVSASGKRGDGTPSKVGVSSASTPVFTVDGKDASQITVSAPTAMLTAGERIDVTLSGKAALDAHSYPVTAADNMAAATVALSGASSAKLHADGPVTGTAEEGSTVDNRSGTGSCAGVTLLTGATAACPP